ncbi:unnamed protein product [Symbiodinium sp. CCMP2592]|nr:unnamed protein product [Symbiodinium sp. CCMP2592]
MTPMPCSGAPTGMEMWAHGLVRDDYQSFGECCSPSEWSSPPYWSLVEQFSKLIKEKDLLLNECYDLCNDNQALRIDNEKLHEALRIQGQELERVAKLMRDDKMTMPLHKCSSDNAFYDRNDLVARMHGESPRRSITDLPLEALRSVQPHLGQTKKSPDLSELHSSGVDIKSRQSKRCHLPYLRHLLHLKWTLDSGKWSKCPPWTPCDFDGEQPPKAFYDRNDLVAWMHGESPRRSIRKLPAEALMTPPCPVEQHECILSTCSVTTSTGEPLETLLSYPHLSGNRRRWGSQIAAFARHTADVAARRFTTIACGSKCDKSTSTGPLDACVAHGPALLEYFSAARLQCQIPAKRGQEHVAKGLIESDAVVAFSDGVDRILSDSEPFPDDVERKKRFDCLLIDESNVKARFLPWGDPSSYSPQSRLVFISGQDWCVMLARTSTTHFSEDYVRQTVGNNLADLLTHCLDSDEGVRAAAHHIIQEHALGALGFVKELIADTVLRQMTDILSTGRETQTTWRLMAPYMAHLEPLLRWLTKSQRQDWASLLVNFLHSLQSTSAQTRATYQKLAVGHLKLLCFADDDASRTYADERRQLLALSDSPDFEEVKNGIASLFRIAYVVKVFLKLWIAPAWAGAEAAAYTDASSSETEMKDDEQPNIEGENLTKSTAVDTTHACSFGVLFCGWSAMPDSSKVPDILAWRDTSEQTRSPEVLLRHVAELGRLVRCSRRIFCWGGRILSDSEPFPDDAEGKKRFDCVRAAAHHIIRQHAWGALGFVKELIADTVLSQMTDILSTDRGTQTTRNHILRYMDHLEPLLRCLTKRQRQNWASLLVKFLHRLQPASVPNRAACHKLVVDHLKLLCFADDDPSRTYADEKRQLLALSDSPDFAEAILGCEGFLLICLGVPLLATMVQCVRRLESIPPAAWAGGDLASNFFQNFR